MLADEAELSELSAKMGYSTELRIDLAEHDKKKKQGLNFFGA
jgi:hypothetical protein